jgi:two-component system, chemotaxis family, CheB/CheR fusion protein
MTTAIRRDNVPDGDLPAPDAALPQWQSLNVDRLFEQIEALAVASQRKDAFIATLSHELRQPLAPIFMAIEVLKKEPSEGAAAQAREILERQARQMLRLLDDISPVSIAGGPVELRKARVDLREAIADARHVVQPLLGQRQQQLAISLPDGSALVVEGDPSRLQQILSNLLINASKYSDDGGQIAVAVERDGAWLLLRVRDTGRGIEPEALPYVFDLFVRGSAERGGGLGLGLAIVKQLVEAHAGTVEAHSAGRGQGSEFIVRLPSASEPARADQFIV